MPLPEQIAVELAAIDATLKGQSVDPEHAELAELALLLADSRPEIPSARAVALDRRFTALQQSGRGRRVPELRARGRTRFLRPAYGAGLALAAVLAVLVVVLATGDHSTGTLGPRSGVSDLSRPVTHAASGASGSSSSGASAASSSASGASSAAATAPGTSIPTPRPGSRPVVQSARLSLTAAGDRIATVAQELYDVVGNAHGIVNHSVVTSGPGAHASFSLAIPSARLSVTLSRLARLRYAVTTSTSASTSDVNGADAADRRRLADARALRASLLTQLQAATTTAAIASLNDRLHRAETTITHDAATLAALQNRVSYAAVKVTIVASAPVVSGHRSGFTLTRAAHDALDVLKTAAGITLIALAVALPVALIVAVIVGCMLGWRRRDRQRALDGA